MRNPLKGGEIWECKKPNRDNIIDKNRGERRDEPFLVVTTDRSEKVHTVQLLL